MTQELEQKVDETVTAAQAEQEAKSILVEEDAAENPAPPIPTEEEPQFASDPGVQEALVSGMEARQDAPDVSAEEVQVAGLGDIVRAGAKYLSERATEAERVVTPGLPDVPIQERGGRLLIRQMPEEEIDDINRAMGGDYVKGINLPEIYAGMDDQEMADWFGQLKSANADLFEDARRGTLNIDALINLADDIGADQIVERILNRKMGAPLPAEEVVGGVLAVRSTFQKTRELFEAAQDMPEGVERQLAMAKWAQMLTLTQRLSVQLSGGGSEAARSTYAMGALQKAVDMPRIEEIADNFSALLGADGPEQIEHLGILYASLPTTRAKNKFMAASAGALGRGMDVITEIWINSILSLPVTHAVNIAGNASFMTLRTLETFVASGVGKVRSTLTGDPDYVKFREGVAQLEGIREGWKEALIVAGKTIVTEAPSGATKIDVRRPVAIGSTGDMTEIYRMVREGNVSAAALNVFGSTMRAGGRALLAEDAFFKGIGYRMSINEQAEIVAGNTYDAAIKAGKSEQEANMLAAVERTKIKNNPNPTITKEAEAQSEIGTFQGDLDGWLGDIQGGMSHPLAKIIVPFYKTPTNVMKETLTRSPIMALNPGFYKTIKAGGREADLAIARVGTGSAVMATFAYHAQGLIGEDSDMFIVGSGPPSPKVRQAMARKGVQPYSINLKNYDDDGLWDGTYTSITYSKLDPISGLLAMAADFAYYSNYDDDMGQIEALAVAATVGMQEYMMNMPLLQGVEELTSIFTLQDTKQRGIKLQEFFAKKATETGLALLPSVSSFSAGIERQMDPTVRSTMLPEEGLFGEDPTQLPTFARGFYTALAQAQARNPFFSKTVPPKLNLWGEEITAGTGEAWEFWSPIRIKETVYTPLDDEIIRLGQGISMPKSKQHGVLLNNVQYNEMITNMNTMDHSGLLPGEPGYETGQTLADELMTLIKNPEYQAAEEENQHQAFNNIIFAYRQGGRDRLFADTPSLQSKKEQLQ